MSWTPFCRLLSAAVPLRCVAVYNAELMPLESCLKWKACTLSMKCLAPLVSLAISLFKILQSDIEVHPSLLSFFLQPIYVVLGTLRIPLSHRFQESQLSGSRAVQIFHGLWPILPLFPLHKHSNYTVVDSVSPHAVRALCNANGVLSTAYSVVAEVVNWTKLFVPSVHLEHIFTRYMVNVGAHVPPRLSWPPIKT